ncbi:MAG: hypothetical protein ACO1N5_13800, partial [Noviherbaspirillum sp.]
KISETGAAFLHQHTAPHGDNSVLHTGYQLGTVYDSNAILRDGTAAPAPTLGDYVESTIAGVRAPHVWLRSREGKRVSLVDLWGSAFTLLIMGQADTWAKAADKLREELGVPLSILHVGEHGDYVPEDDKFSRLYGACSTDAFLIRPDGFIARRLSETASTDGQSLLRDTLRQLLGLSGSDTQAVGAAAASSV